MREKENLIDILSRAKQAVKENDNLLMKELSNRTIHSASIYGDTDNVAVAVLVYALSKIIEREKYREYKEWPDFFHSVIKNIDKAIDSLNKDDLNGFRNSLRDIRRKIGRISGNLRRYIQDVFRKAEINKASRIYEHGISMQKTAEMLGVNIFELAEYAGTTGIGDVDLSITQNIEDRIKTAREILK